MNCMATYFVFDEEGNVKDTWLLSGSDDSSIRIWDMKPRNPLRQIDEKNGTMVCLEKLQEHKNGVMCLALTSREKPCDSLYSGGQDHFTIFWDMKVIEQRIEEMRRMEAEEMRSKKNEAKERFLEAKLGKRKKGKKGKGKGKGKKGKK